VEIPHSLGVVLRLAGAAELIDAKWTDMRCSDVVVPRAGSARLTLRHDSGVHTDIASDLTSPVQERRITLEFTRGSATGHYPISDQDDHAQLVIAGQRQVFRDDALTRFVVRAYLHFQDGPGDHGTFELHSKIVRLLATAKQHCLERTAEPTEEELAEVRAVMCDPSFRASSSLTYSVQGRKERQE
jgi:hypothetical protein